MKKVWTIIICFLLCSCSNTQPKQENKTEKPEQQIEVRKDIDVSFLAVGDDLIHGAVFGDPYCKTENGWDYSGIYEHTKDMIQAADIANINQETILGGRELGLSHYPSFNSPHEFADALAETGFDWVSQATNHCLDKGEAGILSNLEYWDNYQGKVIVTGINRSQKERDTARILDKNGMKIGLLNYTYGTNGYVVPDGKDYLVNYIDKDQIQNDIEQLNKNKVDVIIASMHWGSEYNFGITDEQKELAQFLSDAGVRVIIGSHPHVIEPAEYITSKDGKKTLVYYSLGNFVSAQDVNYRMLGGMATFDLHLDGESGEVSAENAKFYPTITHFETGYVHFKTYLLKDYTENLASMHGLSSTLSRSYFVDLCNEVMGQPTNIEVIY